MLDYDYQIEWLTIALQMEWQNWRLFLFVLLSISMIVYSLRDVYCYTVDWLLQSFVHKQAWNGIQKKNVKKNLYIIELN